MCNCQKPCKFHNKDNTLTVYALCCGYQEYYEAKKMSIVTKLYKEANGYHVRQFDHFKHERLCWETFTSLKTARKRFNELVRSAKWYEKHLYGKRIN